MKLQQLFEDTVATLSRDVAMCKNRLKDKNLSDEERDKWKKKHDELNEKLKAALEKEKNEAN